MVQLPHATRSVQAAKYDRAAENAARTDRVRPHDVHRTHDAGIRHEREVYPRSATGRSYPWHRRPDGRREPNAGAAAGARIQPGVGDTAAVVRRRKAGHGGKDTAAKKLPPEALQALVAPIALYPDPLLAQTLAASTYPLEIVQLHQYMLKYPKLKDQALVDSIKKQPWDPIIQSMAAVPEVVKRLHDDIQWTTDLGNAFLAQQSEVMDAVQVMRKKAKDKGALESNEQQKVEVQVVESKQVIVVESTNPEVIYVPSYSPTWCMGPRVCVLPVPADLLPAVLRRGGVRLVRDRHDVGRRDVGRRMLLCRLGWWRQHLHQQQLRRSWRRWRSWWSRWGWRSWWSWWSWWRGWSRRRRRCWWRRRCWRRWRCWQAWRSWRRWWWAVAVAARVPRAAATPGRTTLRIEVERRTATGQPPTSLVDPLAAMSARREQSWVRHRLRRWWSHQSGLGRRRWRSRGAPAREPWLVRRRERSRPGTVGRAASGAGRAARVAIVSAIAASRAIASGVMQSVAAAPARVAAAESRSYNGSNARASSSRGSSSMGSRGGGSRGGGSRGGGGRRR